MAAQGFLLLASYLLVLLVLARPLGMCLARMVNDIPLPALPGSSARLVARGRDPRRRDGLAAVFAGAPAV